MSEQLKFDEVNGWGISTIRTDAGGATASQPPGAPFSSADYIEETPWPFETLAWREGDHYHEAYKSRTAALRGHGRIVDLAQHGMLTPKGTRKPFGVPTLTPEQYKAGRLQGD